MTRVMMPVILVGLFVTALLGLGISIALAARASVHQRRASRADGHGWSDPHVWMSADGTTDCDASGASAGDCGSGDGGGGGGSD